MCAHSSNFKLEYVCYAVYYQTMCCVMGLVQSHESKTPYHPIAEKKRICTTNNAQEARAITYLQSRIDSDTVDVLRVQNSVPTSKMSVRVV